jgi:hypothetical protein
MMQIESLDKSQGRHHKSSHKPQATGFMQKRRKSPASP